MKSFGAKKPLNNTPTSSPIGLNAALSLNKKSLAAFPTRHPLIQPKLKIGQPNDKYEQEADRVADQVMSMPETKQSSVNGHWSLEKVGSGSPLIQRQSDECPECNEKEEEEEEETVQARSLSYKSPSVPPGLQGEIQSMKGGGQPLTPSARSFFEPHFGRDFGNVRVHTGATAAEAAKSINAKAFTIGRHMLFGAGQYSPGTPAGKHLLAHELTHVMQQKDSGGTPGIIQRWMAKDHEVITNSIIQKKFPGKFSPDARRRTAHYSGEMDLRVRNYAWHLVDKTKIEKWPVVGKPAGQLKGNLDEAELPLHGEANLYDPKNTISTGRGTSTLCHQKKGKRTKVNEAKANEYNKEAIIQANSPSGGINNQTLLDLGLALHVGQDRGAHDEGIAGCGHSRKNWNPDDLNQNTEGRKAADTHSEKILNDFLSRLSPKIRTQLTTVKLPDLAGKSQFVLGAPLPSQRYVLQDPTLLQKPPLFYMAITKNMFKDPKTGMPLRWAGIWNPLWRMGLGYIGGGSNAVSVDPQVGLRAARLTRRIYVDAFTGAVLGYNFNDRQIMAGISYSVQVNYTGKSGDYGLILSRMKDLVGNNDMLVVGVSGMF